MIRILIILVVTCFDLKGQSLNPKYNFKHLNVQNGLTQNIVYHFLQDSHGFMWIGTHNGLTLYDGIKTTNFLRNEQDSTTISGNFINSILEDSIQQIWIGNENGIDLYNRSDNSFSHFGVDRPDGTKDNTYCVLLGFVSANELWFLDTKTRSIRSLNVNTKSTSFISELNTNHALFYKGSAQTVHIWSAYDIGTIHQICRNSELIGQQTYFSGKNDPLNNPALEVTHVFQQNDTIVWLSTNEGLVKLNPALNKYRIFNRWQNQIVRELRYAALSPKGHLWVGSGPAGIYSFDVNTNQFIDNFRNNKLDVFSICSDNIVSLYFDKTGNIWCGSYGNGSSYAGTENILFSSHFSKNETQAWNGNNNISWLGSDLHDNVWCMLADAPGFWILDKEFKIRMHKNPLLENGANFNGGMYKLLFDKGDVIWCTTNKGLYKYNIRTNKMHPIKYELISEEVQGSMWIRDITRLNDGSILFSTFVGLYLLTDESGKPVIKPITFLNPGAYSGFGTVFQDKANLVYVKSLGDSLYILKPTGEGKHFELFKSLRFKPAINHFFNEKGDSIIYLATSDGLYHINSKNLQIEKESFNNKLPFLNVNSVFKKDNKFWIFGEKGLYFFDERNKRGRRYTVEDGLPTNEFSLSALVYTPDDRCIAGTSNGLVTFFPHQKQDSIYPPRPRITNIYINDTLHISTRNPNETKKISLSYRENTFSFDFAPIAFQHVAECSFEFKLEGYDETWVKSDVAHYTRYSKIPPGSYVFGLRVIDAMGRVSPFTKTLEIAIAKAFWQTTFFKSAGLVFILLVGWLFSKRYLNYKIRKQRLEFEKQQAIERERTRIATDMHDDLGAGLTRIKFITESISEKSNDPAIEPEAEKLRISSNELVDKMGEIIWAMNDKNNSLEDLFFYLRSYAVDYCQENDLICEFPIPEAIPQKIVGGQVRRNVFLVLKESLHNVVKHANATKVSIHIVADDKLSLSISDDGKGFEQNAKNGGNGLLNMQRRAEALHGNLVVSNSFGTTVQLEVPV